MSRRNYRVILLSVLVLCAMLMVSVSVMITPDHGKAKLAVNEGWIVGQVTNGTGPIANACVLYVLAMASGGPLGSVFTNSTGYYNLTVLGGVSYMVIAFQGDYFAASGAATPPVGGAAVCDITMNSISPMAADVVLTGYVLDGSGNPVPGGNVIGYVLDPLNGGEGVPMYGNVTVANATTGRYTVNVIPGPIGGGVAAMGYAGYGFIENMTRDPLESNHTYWLNITLSVPPSTDDAVLSGRVTDADTGSPLEGAVVTAETSNQFNKGGYSNYTMTNSTGYYSMNVTNGSGRMYFQMGGYSGLQIQNFEIHAGDHLVVNATLIALTATISGNVTDASTGLPIPGAQVVMMDSNGRFSSTTTNASGQYVMDAFASTGAWVGAQLKGYSSNYSIVDVLPGDHLWVDIGLWQLDSWLTGTVTDLISDMPVVDASVQVHGPSFNMDAKTNSSGVYNISLLAGNYTIDVNHPNYNSYHTTVSIDKGGNTLDFQLMPMNPPATTRLFGWVNDTESGEGIGGAQVEVALAPPYQGQTLRVSTNFTGYYEAWVVPMMLQYLVTSNDHMHANGSINATGQAEVRLDVSLEPDPWGPNLTYSQSPTENISWTNPTVIDVTVVEKDPLQFVLVQFMFLNASNGWSDYAVVNMLYDSFNPMGNGQFTLPYMVTSNDTYAFHVEWNGQCFGGWLTNGSSEMYLASFGMIWGGTPYQGIRGLYGNSSMGMGQQGTAFFNNITGDFELFRFDNGSMGQAMPGDPTAWFSPTVSLVRLNESTGSSNWMDAYPEGTWSLPGLKFLFNSTAPSGKYLTEFGCQDFGNQGNGTGSLITVDNDPPIADAGVDQTVPAVEAVNFDGTGSHDNVGIVNYTWVVDDGGTPVVLWGANPSFTFLSEGQYNVTLTVTDGAGHTSSDVVVITVTAAIPEFPTILLPISGMIAMIALYHMRRIKRDE